MLVLFYIVGQTTIVAPEGPVRLAIKRLQGTQPEVTSRPGRNDKESRVGLAYRCLGLLIVTFRVLQCLLQIHINMS